MRKCEYLYDNSGVCFKGWSGLCINGGFLSGVCIDGGLVSVSKKVVNIKVVFYRGVGSAVFNKGIWSRSVLRRPEFS